MAKSGDAVGGNATYTCPPQKCFLAVLKNVQNTENTLKYNFFNRMTYVAIYFSVFWRKNFVQQKAKNSFFGVQNTQFSYKYEALVLVCT
jgi:hypothetical protein